LGGTQEIFDAVSEDFLGGTGKAEDAKLPGAGIIPKLCSMERAGMERMDWTSHIGESGNNSHKGERRCSVLRRPISFTEADPNRVATDCRRLSDEALVIVYEWPQ
jgi:hypothetical protein